MARPHSLLSDFAANEIGWQQVADRFQLAIDQKTRQALDATGEEYLDLRGQRRGWIAALALLETIRKENEALSRGT